MMSKLLALPFGTTRFFTLMSGTSIKVQTQKRRLECLPMPSSKVQKLMRKTRLSKGRNAELQVIKVTRVAKQLAKFHTGEKLIAKQRQH
jgi:hypothetical protein